MRRARCFFEGANLFLGKRFGKLKVHKRPFARVGMELAQEKDFSGPSAREDFSENSKPLPTFPELRAGRKNPLAMGGAKLRQCKPGELRWPAATSLPDICARLARIASRIN